MCCKDLENVLEDHPNLFKKYLNYGIVISWIELSKEGAFHKTHNYGIPIGYCPFCGQKLVG
jgi:hypothetical protein